MLEFSYEDVCIKIDTSAAPSDFVVPLQELLCVEVFAGCAQLSASVREMGFSVICENTRSASPVFPQLGLEPNHAGLASQSLFLLEEFLQSKTQWHSKTFSSSKNDLKEFRAHSNVFQSSQNKTSSTQTQNNLPNSSQNNMFLRHGSNNIQNTKNPQKNEKSTSKLFHAQTGSIWFQIGSYVVPTWFLRFSIVQMVVPTNLKVTYLFSCTCNVPR